MTINEENYYLHGTKTLLYCCSYINLPFAKFKGSPATAISPEYQVYTLTKTKFNGENNKHKMYTQLNNKCKCYTLHNKMYIYGRFSVISSNNEIKEN